MGERKRPTRGKLARRLDDPTDRTYGHRCDFCGALAGTLCMTRNGDSAMEPHLARYVMRVRTPSPAGAAAGDDG